MDLNNILLIHSTSGHIPERQLVPHLRLAAKVLVLERHRSVSSSFECSWSNKGRCFVSLRQALLLHGGAYALRVSLLYIKPTNENICTLSPCNFRRQHIDESIEKKPSSTENFRNFIEAIRVGAHGDVLVGYLGEVITALATSLDFHYIIMEASSFGSQTPNGSYDGVVGHIERKEGDLGVASLSINHNRYRVIDYTSWLALDPTLFVTRAPIYLKDPFDVFHLFTLDAWSAIGGFLAFSASCVWLFWPSVTPRNPGARINEEMSGLAPRSRHYQDNKRPPFLCVLTTVTKAFLNQGSSHTPPSMPGRLVYVFMLLVAIVVFGVYSGNLTAFLSRPVRDVPPTTVSQLVIRDWSIRLDKAYGTHDLVKGTKTEDYQMLYRRAQERGDILENTGARPSSNTNVQHLLKKNIAIVMGATGAYYMLNRNTGPGERCILSYSQEAMAKEYAALAVTKKSLLKPVFDKK
nr:glutamate receptor 1-like [Cherax quadricarinatus]